jgi:uncharacterized protein (DUF2147 family)
MKRVLWLTFLLLIWVMPTYAEQNPAASDVVGYWFMRDLGSRDYVGIIFIYEYEGKIYGRTMVSFDTKTGEVFSYVDEEGETARYLIGSPRTLGLDVMWNLEWDERRGRYINGSIMDPRRRRPYSAQIWRVGNTLRMRGSLGPFGATVDWELASASDLPAGTPSFKTSDLVPILFFNERGQLVPAHNP